MSKEIKEELNDYLVTNNINALFVDIVEAILVDKPVSRLLLPLSIAIVHLMCLC